MLNPKRRLAVSVGDLLDYDGASDSHVSAAELSGNPAQVENNDNDTIYKSFGCFVFSGIILAYPSF